MSKFFQIAVVLTLVMTGCRQPIRMPALQLIAGQTMGTTYSIKLVPSDSLPPLPEVSAEVEAELQRVNDQMSTYQVDSEVSRFNRSESTDWFAVSSETAAVVQLAQEISRLSDGAFDVTVGPLVNLWGFGPDNRPVQVPSDEQIDGVLQHTGSAKLEVRLTPPALRKADPQVKIDLSAIAKGHGVDRVANVLNRLGAEAYFIEIGGEIRTRGVKLDGQPWQVGIERPVAGLREIHQVIGLSDQSLATSGDYRNFYEMDGRRFSHTIDPRTGWPVEEAITSASAIAETCALADAIATSMMVRGFSEGLEIAEQNDWAVLLMRNTDDGLETVESRGFQSMFSKAGSDSTADSKEQIP